MTICVTRPFLPDIEEYISILKSSWESKELTNQGPLVKRLQQELAEYLDTPYVHCVSNGTIALQLALASLGIKEGEVITTPFSYVATISSILWERCRPVFVDINPEDFTIDPSQIERAITKNTKAIMGVHVFGNACAVEKIEQIAQKHNLKVIYDGAHAFGSRYKGKSLLSYGDVATCSFHATKLFHTVEGGACLMRDKAISDKLELQKRFGHVGDTHICLGINGKLSEFHAAMGVANFPYVTEIIKQRKYLSELYDKFLLNRVQRPKINKDLDYNYAYYPVVFKSETELLNVAKRLEEKDIHIRRYFYPSLNTLPYVQGEPCAVAEDISRRIACLPLYIGLTEEDIQTIATLITENVE